MSDIDVTEKFGEDRSEGISWNELMERDSRPAPDILTEEAYEYRGSDPIPAERYTSEEFAQKEREREQGQQRRCKPGRAGEVDGGVRARERGEQLCHEGRADDGRQG